MLAGLTQEERGENISYLQRKNNCLLVIQSEGKIKPFVYGSRNGVVCHLYH